MNAFKPEALKMLGDLETALRTKPAGAAALAQ
jgi:hypothetical protein